MASCHFWLIMRFSHILVESGLRVDSCAVSLASMKIGKLPKQLSVMLNGQ